MMSGMGHVSLVGAGPGDPGLLTRKALLRLRRADLVLYDALVDERIVALARRAQRFYVGKRAGRHALSQHEIHAVMIRAARRGRRVVRLKGGDPFVFGRGGEEAQALRQAGVPFDVVPGVSSALAVPASAGIPLTHRGLSSAFFVVSGHDRQLFLGAIAALRPHGITIVVLMGFSRRAEIASDLLAAGWDHGVPAAVVADGTRPSQQVWRGALGELAAGEARIAGDAPALLVVGDVAGIDVHASQLAGDLDAPAPRAERTGTKR
jgi:uroporphyrin-III C-methyltransferase/precorrin-2 dehydrogenase/sirohydrochlorin ferrochelatase